SDCDVPAEGSSECSGADSSSCAGVSVGESADSGESVELPSPVGGSGFGWVHGGTPANSR
ncbi:MAG: hypothetical protein L7U55_07000, partial [Candidatus Nanopelagicales bacterium]|nr:hypothetical protein [Candidatus Nanopelagicales bacterium]